MKTERDLSLGAYVLAGVLWVAPASAQQEPHHPPAFRLDPVADGAFIGGTLVVTFMLEAIIGTGEIEAQLPDDEAELLPIDRWAAERDEASLGAAQASDLGVLAVAAWAVTDTVLAGVEHRADPALTHAALYVESATTTWFISNLFKIAVRRPRPRAYIE
ncbi:MAG TPA: hypothetical protein VIM73_03545, partial [Polyangiaceae bacterium]